MKPLRDIFPRKHQWVHIKYDPNPQSEKTLSHLINTKTDIYLSNMEAFDFMLEHIHELLILPSEIVNGPRS